MTQRYYGVGIQTFEEIRSLNAAYVDKSGLIYRMAQTGKCYFLSRPRRFGKSLLVSTMKAYFQGRKDLFTGLEVEKLERHWCEYPVLCIDLSRTAYLSKEHLDQALDGILRDYEAIYGRDENDALPGTRFHRLIGRAHAQTGKKVVVLIDEYDAPLLDALDKPALLETLRDEMRAFYKPLKANDSILKFVFLTGITKFSQLSIFSALNNLNDISMLDTYATICGFSEQELYTQMAEDIRALGQAVGLNEDETKADLKRRYDGYHFSKKSPDVYNPFSIICAFANQEMTNYWFASGTPSFLAKATLRYRFDPPKLEGFAADVNEFDTPTDSPNGLTPILYQAGYLTIKDYDGGFYTLGFPNNEVRFSFYKTLMKEYVDRAKLEFNFGSQLTMAMKYDRIDDVMRMIRAFMASIPYDTEKQDENHYKTIFYLIFRLFTAYDIRTEERTASGRCNALVETQTSIYIFEFKLPKFEERTTIYLGRAMKQMDEKGYTVPYEARDKPVYKVAATFDDARRTIGTWVVEKVRDASRA